MSDKDEKSERVREILQKGYVPQDKDHAVQGGYVPETSEAGSPPTGGSGATDPKKK